MKERLKEYFLDILKTKNKRLTLVTYLLAPFVCNIIVEIFNARSIISGFTYIFRDTSSFFINLMIISASISIGLLLKKRLAYVYTVGTLWVTMSIVNFVITSKRTTPFSASDFKLLGSIDDTIEKYLNPLELILIIIAIAFVVVAVSYVWMKMPKYAEKICYWKNFVFIAIVFGAMALSISLGYTFGALSTKFPNMTIAYEEFGFPYCFATSFVNKGVDQPDEYSKEKVMSIVDKIESTATVDEDKLKTPNIIFLQLESFIDVSKIKDLVLSKDATPVFNELKEKYPSGYLTVNNVGYGTANTEFEVMTGLNLDDFGPGEFPYTTILTKTTCETTGYILKEYGYSTHAIHNNTATFYSRRSVFKRLGFDTFTSIEYMNVEEFTPTEWAKDSVLSEEIIKVLNSTEESDYIYAMSVQGHGDYPAEKVLTDEEISVISGIEDEGQKYMMEYYVNMIYEMDIFIGQLIEQLKSLGEETVLVLFGDHLPSIDLEEEDLENGDLYQTEYVVWNNCNMAMSDKDIETYQLSSRVLEYLNIDGGMINKFHQTFNYSGTYLEKLHLLTFDILYGNMFAYDGINPYIATDMKMGTYDIKINGIKHATSEVVKEYGEEDNLDVNQQEETTEEAADSDVEEPVTGDNPNEVIDEVIEQDWYIVEGEHFTNYSFVNINGNECDTIFMDSNHLLIYAPLLDSLDVLCVNQKSNSTILSTSESFTYFNINDTPSEDTEDNEDDNFGADKQIEGDI